MVERKSDAAIRRIRTRLATTFGESRPSLQGCRALGVAIGNGWPTLREATGFALRRTVGTDQDDVPGR